MQSQYSAHSSSSTNTSGIFFTPSSADFSVDCTELNQAYKEPIENWYSGRIAAAKIEGERSVFIEHPLRSDAWLKLKGAGNNGKWIDFKNKHATGPTWPRFDFDGRRMTDEAIGHDNAFEGGASFRQARIEWAITCHLASAGYEVVPCLGYGRITCDGTCSWFSVFEVNKEWKRIQSFPTITAGAFHDLMTTCGDILLQIALEEELIGNCWFYGRPDGSRIIRDLHPFIKADNITMSALSWVMQTAFALHLPTVFARHKAKDAPLRDPGEFAIAMFKNIYPKVTTDDYDKFRFQIVKQYMLDPTTDDFRPEKLLKVLRDNPITAALLERCPSKFAVP